MADRRRCVSCGVQLPVAAARCPSCGHEVGDPVAVGPATSGGRGRRVALGVGVAVSAVMAVLVVIDNDRTRSRDIADPAAPTSTSTSTSTAQEAGPPPPGTALTVEPLGGVWPDVGELRFLRWAQSGPGELVDPGADVATEVQLAERGPIVGIVPRLDGAVIVAAGRAVYHPTLPGTVGAVDLGPADQAWASDRASSVWLLTGFEDADDEHAVREIDVVQNTGTVEVTIPADVWPMAGVAGGLLVRGPDGGYVIGRDGGTRRVTNGAIVDAVPTTMLVRACDEQLSCGYRLVDLRSGAEGPANGFSDLSWWEIHLAPDGSAVASIDHDREQQGWRLVIVDLTTGAIHEHALATEGSPPPTASVTWSPDGRWLIMGRQNSLSFFQVDESAEAVVDRPGSLAAVTVIG